MSLKYISHNKVTLTSQHVRKATVQGFKPKITQKIHVLLENKHLKKISAQEKRRVVLLTLR